MTTLAYYMERPAEELPFDVSDALGLDATGRDGDDRFPYTWANLTPDEQDKTRALFPSDVAIEVAANLANSDPDSAPIDLRHYMLHHYMPLPNQAVRALDVNGPTSTRVWTWAQLTTAEQDKLLDWFLPATTAQKGTN